jgi:hypothetical protein
MQKLRKDRQGNQRFRCHTCSKTFSELQPRPLGEMRLSLDRALLCLQLILEGNSIRSTERITGVHRDTILSLLVMAGERCTKVMEEKLIALNVRDVQCDEMWGYVGMKEKQKGYDKKGVRDTLTFMLKLQKADSS